MKCSKCHSPDRRLCTYKNPPDLEEVTVGNWIELLRCSECSQYWCGVPHEPYASFNFWTSWPFEETDFISLNRIENAIILHEWHDHVIREDYNKLPQEEIKAVEMWRDRTYRNYNSVDKDQSKFKYCQKSEDIYKYKEKYNQKVD